MRLVTAAAEARARQRQVHVNGRDYTLSEYVGAAPVRGHYLEGNEVNDNGLPQGFLVHQPPNAITPAHFHEPNQFQVFVGGAGRMGAFPAKPITVQYANGHTPYGPIVAGDQGVEYFTLRQRWDPGAKYMPASRDKLKKGNQRTRIKGDIAVGNPVAAGAPVMETVIAPEADGLAAWIVRLGPGAETALPSPRASGGQYLLVAAGEMKLDGRTLDRLSAVYLTDSEPAFTAVAGRDGLDLLVLQFPRLASG